MQSIYRGGAVPLAFLRTLAPSYECNGSVFSLPIVGVGAMLHHPEHDNLPVLLQQRIREECSVTRELMFEHAAGDAEAAKRIQQLIEAGAFTDAALALINLELPHWKLRRLAYEDGLWHCSLSKWPGLPAGLDDTAEASREILPLAILSAFVEARRDLSASPERPKSVPVVPLQAVTTCCDNFT